MTARMGVAVVGAADLPGEALIEALQDSGKVLGRIYALDADAQLGKTLEIGTHRFVVDDAATFDFSSVGTVLFAPGTASELIARKQAQAQACTVIDLATTPTLLDDAVSADAQVLQQLLSPLVRIGTVTEIRITLCQAVASRGRAGVEALIQQTRQLLTFQPLSFGVLPQQLAFNVLAGDEGARAQALSQQLVRSLGVVAPQITILEVPVLLANSYLIDLKYAQACRVEGWRDALAAAEIACAQVGDAMPSAVTDGSGQARIAVGVQPCEANDAVQLWAVADAWRVLAAKTVQSLMKSRTE